jgi:hypothetical protein
MTSTATYRLLHDRLNRETARLQWHELLPHFASGNVVAVDSSLDLIDVAVRMSLDEAALIGKWIEDGLFGRVSDAQASVWLNDDPALWTVIVKPWVLVQPAVLA